MPGTALRRCLACLKLFLSMSPAERFCGPCRKRRKGKMKIGVLGEPVSLTPDMERHLAHVETFGIMPYRDPVEVLTEDALEFLDNPNKKFDDNFIYDELDKEERLAKLMEDRENGRCGKGRFRGMMRRRPKPVEVDKVKEELVKAIVTATVKAKRKTRTDDSWIVF